MKSELVLALFLIAACAKAPASVPPPAEPAPQQQTSGPRVTFPNGHVVRVEVVADPEARAQGLMFRDQVRPGTGMIFFFPEDGAFSFWMKNTLVPLDMIWIDQQKRVAHVQENVPPCKADPCPSYGPQDPGLKARYILEVGGGVVRQQGLKVGDTLRFEGMDRVVAR